MKKTISLALAMMTAIPLTACSGNQKDEIEYVAPEVERYQNHIEIEGQWGESIHTGEGGQYGIGDPFVMRYNGKYYLYPSTSDPCSGIKVFESDDLVHWTYKGFAVPESQDTSHGAYAPEVVYYNGYFYMCQSRAGKGHYIYRSKSPTEGFELVSSSGRDENSIDYGNIGMGIDGSFYVSDEGKLYLLHTSTPAALQFNEITDVANINTETVGPAESLGDANLNHWIEGPGIFRRGGFSYLTYTGNHVISKGYRVAYSYAENLTDLSSFIQPQDNVTIIDTVAEHYGLGHSSNVNGPDLDSIYTAYHSMVGGGPARRYNLDRYFANGSILTANGVTHRPVSMPSEPRAGGYSDSLALSNGVYAIGSADDYFTAEYNFLPDEGQEIVAGSYRLHFANGKAVLAENGKTVAEADCVLPSNALACVRVENGDGVGYVYVNGMRVLSYKAHGAAGQIGYTRLQEVGYTAFTNDVFGSSDFEAFKNFPAKFPATSYLKGEMRGFSLAKAKRVLGGVRVGEKESTVRVGDAYAVSLRKGDWVKYAADVPADGAYTVSAEFSAKSAGAKIKISMGDEEFAATVPRLDPSHETTRVYLGEIKAKAGVSAMKVEVLSGEAEITLFEVNECAQTNVVDLKSYDVRNGSVREEDGAIRVSGNNGVLLWKNTEAVNFEATVTFSCAAEIGTDFGFMLRSSHYSYHPAQPAQSWRGYYLKLDTSLVTLRRFDYGDCGYVASKRTGAVDLTGGGTHTLVIRAEGHSFSVVLDGTVTLSGEDPCAFFTGGLGVYAGTGEITVHALRFQKL